MKKIKKIITSLKNEIINQRLSNGDLIWIDKDNIRLCNWLYLLIKRNGGNYKLRSINIDEMYLDRSAHTNIERYNNIIKSLLELNSSKKDKISFINQLKNIWSNDIVKYTKIKELLNEKDINQMGI